MRVYFYNADIYCEDCGDDIKRRIRKELKATGSKDSPVSQDSNEWPQAVADGGGESDCPQHCASQGECLNATAYLDSDHKSGLFLENPLTSDGEEYVREQHRTNCSAITQMWLEHYGLTVEDKDSEESDDFPVGGWF